MLKPGRAGGRVAGPPAPEDRAVFRGTVLPWVFLLPSLLVLAVFIYLPALQTLRLAAYRANVILGTEQFTGLENLTELLLSPTYQQVALQTLIFTLLTVSLGLLLSLGLAWLASRPIRGAKTYRLLLIYPYALSPAIAGTLWLFLFNPEIGVVNQLLGAAFNVRPRWLDTPLLAFLLVTLAAVWKGLAYNIVFYLASIQNLPGDVLEAAEIDGATPAQVFWRVAFPLLSPITFFLVFTNIIAALFDSFALTDLLTRGGPYVGHAGVTTFLMYQLYQDGFVNFKTGAAAVQAALMLVLVALVTWTQFRLGERRVHYGA
ncbi:carbohydrate ABC transporter membrane protein 1, CUT1 family (plasmid) [Deinococcus geothermalis DSM 11300]|uniref:Carbohydrate ABC transporter membrane protein 1, CUT1 family n=1 Tax=Deinococcus geothermalis (strain DSM 11300 / CIP 105573 / AG-3a) TaxID=319795 RepID=Q1J338_DEIGD|nr:sugar ABC transporter permease [Deinococcus geothermalis]ABF44096.1 carbohydrate ABC transporter membrane protein 1, CUT1 family [Deinococcus geothermalis DSM 11300]